MSYLREAFDVLTFDQAKNVVLSTDTNNPSKFEQETRFLVDSISSQVSLTNASTVFDFGCGMGRVAKELISLYDCNVIGLDISPSMLLFAKLYTANLNKFHGVLTYAIPDSIDMAMSIFALQHTEFPQREIDNIASILKPNGIFVLLNEHKRFVPDDVDKENFVVWKDDGFHVHKYVESKLTKVHSTPYVDDVKEIVFYRKEK